MTSQRNTLILIATALLLTGCSSVPAGDAPIPPGPDARLARPAYWYSQPAVAQVNGRDYDVLWNVCQDVAHDHLFDLDRTDYREGLLSTRPMISKQFFELWRPDTGDVHGVILNSLQMVRRTIRFRFEKTDHGFRVSPRVLIERFSQPDRRITSAAQFRQAFAYQTPSAGERQAEVPVNGAEYWYAIGRDLELEKQLADDVRDRLH